MTLRYVVRAVTDAADMRALEDVQVAAWGYADREVLPGTMFRISAASGGVVVAAYPEGPARRSGWRTASLPCGTGGRGTTRTCWPCTPTGAGAARPSP